jgi:hypothetical protein
MTPFGILEQSEFMLLEDDIQNHGAVVLAKDADPSGDRTIGTPTSQ